MSDKSEKIYLWILNYEFGVDVRIIEYDLIRTTDKHYYAEQSKIVLETTPVNFSMKSFVRFDKSEYSWTTDGLDLQGLAFTLSDAKNFLSQAIATKLKTYIDTSLNVLELLK